MKRGESGFTLIEILIASVILTFGLLSVLALFSQSQRMMLASARFETCQRVLNYFEMVHPIPSPDQVTDDPLDNELLNIQAERADDLANELEIELTPRDREDVAGYTVERKVDEIDDEELRRNGQIYTVRTTVKWGGNFRGVKPEEEQFVRLWWKGAKK